MQSKSNQHIFQNKISGLLLLATVVFHLPLHCNTPVYDDTLVINGINIFSGKQYVDFIQPMSDTDGNVDSCHIVRYDDRKNILQHSYLSLVGDSFTESFEDDNNFLNKISPRKFHYQASCKRPKQGPPGPVLGNYLNYYSGLPFQNITAPLTWTPIGFDQAYLTDGKWVVTPTPLPGMPGTGLNYSNPNGGVYLITLSAQANVPVNATFYLGCFNVTRNVFLQSTNGGMISTSTSGVYLLSETFLVRYQANDVLQFQMFCDQLPSGLFKVQPPFGIPGNYNVAVTIIKIQ